MKFIARFGFGVIGLVVVLVLAGGCFARHEGWPPFGPSNKQWTGVFLTNGQAYFGHFYSGPGDYAKLTDVYYVLQTQLQSQDPKVAPQTQLSLQKLGGEVHGPKKEMRIAKSQMLFTEELRADSPLVQSIDQLKTAPAATPARTATPTPTAPAPAATPTPVR